MSVILLSESLDHFRKFYPENYEKNISNKKAAIFNCKLLKITITFLSGQYHEQLIYHWIVIVVEANVIIDILLKIHQRTDFSWQ